jgi:hypothetical protein
MRLLRCKLPTGSYKRVPKYWFTALRPLRESGCDGARASSNPFAGIRPADAPVFLVAQIAGALAATFLFKWLVPCLRANAEAILVPHETAERLNALFVGLCVRFHDECTAAAPDVGIAMLSVG